MPLYCILHKCGKWDIGANASLALKKSTILQKVTNSFRTILKPAFDKKKSFIVNLISELYNIGKARSCSLYITILYRLLKFWFLEWIWRTILIILLTCVVLISQPLFMNVYVYVWYNSLALLSIVQENLLQGPIWLLYEHFKQKVIQIIQLIFCYYLFVSFISL